jgi:serine/threonine protein kinase
VYKGSLPDHTAIAVKRLEGSAQGEKQFRAEFRTLGTIQHVNLVRLRGFCATGHERLLVYDYMPNGSLASVLSESGHSSRPLDWRARFGIMAGVARGLAYLHERCQERIVHCDVKPENILLDAGLRPKVADFGMAKLIARDNSRALTTARGTVGYLAPEWILGLPITAKADVYSMGWCSWSSSPGGGTGTPRRPGGAAVAAATSRSGRRPRSGRGRSWCCWTSG